MKGEGWCVNVSIALCKHFLREWFPLFADLQVVLLSLSFSPFPPCLSFPLCLSLSLPSPPLPSPPLPSPFFFSSQYEDILKAENEGSNSPGIYRTQSYDAVLFDLRKIPPEKIAVGHYCATVREDSGRPLSSH